MKYRLSIIFLLILSVICINECRSQVNIVPEFADDELRFKKLDFDAGMTTNYVNCILEDSLGLIWIGTQVGLNRYNGYEYTWFKPDKNDSGSLPSSWIHNLFLDDQGEIWVCTNYGLSLYDPGKEDFTSFYPNKEEINSDDNMIYGIRQDSRGLFWVYTAGGLFSFDKSDKKFKSYKQFEVFNKDLFFYPGFGLGSCLSRYILINSLIIGGIIS